jgi:hypothetical protein
MPIALINSLYAFHVNINNRRTKQNFGNVRVKFNQPKQMKYSIIVRHLHVVQGQKLKNPKTLTIFVLKRANFLQAKHKIYSCLLFL